MSAGVQRALLTGASGFIGSHVLKALLSQGFSVGCLVRPDRQGEALPNVEWLQAPTETAAIVDAVCGFGPEVILHCGSRVLTEHKISDVDDLIKSNVLLTTALCEAGTALQALRMVNIGTCLEHDETGALSPNSLYAATKCAANQIISYYCNQKGGAAVTLKLPIIYGPADPRRRLLRLLIEAQADGQSIDLSPGHQELNLLHVCDAVRAILVAAKRVVTPENVGRHESFHVGADKTLTLRELVAEIEAVTGAQMPVRWGMRPYREGERLKLGPCEPKLPHWTAKVDTKCGIGSMLESMSTV